MEYGPDGIPVSTKSIIIGPPLKGPAPVPVTPTETVLEPVNYGTVAEEIDSPGNVAPPYAVAVLDHGNLLTSKATSLDFTGDSVSVTTSGGAAVITINAIAGDPTTVVAGAGINVVSSANIVTVTNTFTEQVYNGGNIQGQISPNRSNGTVQKYTLVNNITLNPPTNMTAGQSLTLILSQDSVGGRIMTANAAYMFASGFKDLSTAPTAIDMVNIFTDGTNYYATLTVGYT